MKRIAFVTGAIGFLSIVLIFTVLGSTAAYVPDPGTNTADSSIYLPAMSKPATPRDGVPLCNSHDSTAWHPVYNPEQDCHYDHHHGRDPYDPEIVALLGSPEEYTGQAISYPWETPNENELKHRAYFWMWQVNDRCVKSGIGQQCVKAFRFQLHADMGILGFNARVHSFWGEVLACETGTDNCGIIRWGGHHDTGCGYNAYFGPLVDLPSNPDNCVVPFVNDIPYRILNHPREIAPALDKYNRGISWEQIGGSNVLWAFSDLYIDHAVSRKFVISFLDSYAAVDGDNPNNWEYFCPDFQCVFNGSFMQVTNFQIKKQPAGSFVGWTDLFGKVDPSCKETGPNCVPYVREDWNGTTAGYHRADQFAGPDYHPRGPSHFYEFDQSPGQIGTGSEFWLVPTDHEPRP